jgi:endonuclease YncB( thermonuclease family)
MRTGKNVKFGQRGRKPAQLRTAGSWRPAYRAKRQFRLPRMRLSRTLSQWLFVLVLGGAVGHQMLTAPDRAVTSSTKATNTAQKASGTTLKGRASVVDGDTIEIRGQRIRFNGIDAPESDQRCTNEAGKNYGCGAQSASYLDTLLASSRPTRCEFVTWDQHKRFVGDCYLADGRSVGSLMVSAGHALDWPRYSGGAYSADQATAQSAKLGLWQGPFEAPWDYRAKKRARTAPSAMPLTSNFTASDCNIKGNISINSGERIYHVPGQEYYDETRITTSKGERWFCSEQEARAAGWRRAKR